MYVSMSRLDIPADRAPELVTFRVRAHLADQADGFIDLQVWQSDRDPGEILMVSRWSDRDSFKAYMRSEGHRPRTTASTPEAGRFGCYVNLTVAASSCVRGRRGRVPLQYNVTRKVAPTFPTTSPR